VDSYKEVEESDKKIEQPTSLQVCNLNKSLQQAVVVLKIFPSATTFRKGIVEVVIHNY